RMHSRVIGFGFSARHVSQSDDGFVIAALGQETLSGHSDPTVRALEIAEKLGIREGRFRQWFGLFVLDTPDSGEMVVAVGAHGGVIRAVFWSTSIVMDRGLIVEIDDVKGAIR